ncbi:unnamed protein product [Orchesella dallaii]|uniref:Uncharacterized protein n=1 Tax=Orchesella dallaii TaxID=48710 RepID=A0ABP1S8B7_9HEXA
MVFSCSSIKLFSPKIVLTGRKRSSERCSESTFVSARASQSGQIDQNNRSVEQCEDVGAAIGQGFRVWKESHAELSGIFPEPRFVMLAPYGGEIRTGTDTINLCLLGNMLCTFDKVDDALMSALAVTCSKLENLFSDQRRFSFKEINIHYIDGGTYGNVYRGSFKRTEYVIKQFKQLAPGRPVMRYEKIMKERDMRVLLKILNLVGAFSEIGVYLALE